jgi:hypothetical protein
MTVVLWTWSFLSSALRLLPPSCGFPPLLPPLLPLLTPLPSRRSLWKRPDSTYALSVYFKMLAPLSPPFLKLGLLTLSIFCLPTTQSATVRPSRSPYACPDARVPPVLHKPTVTALPPPPPDLPLFTKPLLVERPFFYRVPKRRPPGSPTPSWVRVHFRLPTLKLSTTKFSLQFYYPPLRITLPSRCRSQRITYCSVAFPGSVAA